MDPILTFLETTSVLRPLYLLSQMSSTDLAIAFLLSKPIFVATAAVAVGGRSMRQYALREDAERLESHDSRPPHLLEDP